MKDTIVTPWIVKRCTCGREGCDSFHIHPNTAFLGITFTREEAYTIANSRELREFLEALLDCTDAVSAINLLTNSGPELLAKAKGETQ